MMGIKEAKVDLFVHFSLSDEILTNETKVSKLRQRSLNSQKWERCLTNEILMNGKEVSMMRFSMMGILSHNWEGSGN
jgi:hypothetical protein